VPFLNPLKAVLYFHQPPENILVSVTSDCHFAIPNGSFSNRAYERATPSVILDYLTLLYFLIISVCHSLSEK
jgi:hypothetical protein